MSLNPRQQLLGMAYSIMPQQQLMGLKGNTMIDPMHTSRQPEMIGPVQNPTMQQLNIGERNSISCTLDENAIMKQVLDTHLPDGTIVDGKSLMQMAEELLQDITINAESTSSVAQTDVVQLEEKYHKIDVLLTSNILSHTIDKLACEMLFKLLTSVDGDSIAISLLHLVENFHWDAKLALILATFALIYSTDQLEMSTDILEQVPMITEYSTPLKPRSDALNELIYSVLELSWCIFQFKELPSVSSKVPAMTRALSTVPTAVYWNVRGIISCAAHITRMGYEYEISSIEIESSELSSLVLKINPLLEFLRKQLEEYNHVIGKKNEMDLIETFSQVLDTAHIDNMNILNILLNPWNEPLPLFDGATKQRVSLEVLRKRNVLLLISGLDMSRDEVSILEQIYSEMRVQGRRMDSLYEVLWVPIVDLSVMNTDKVKEQFEDFMNSMPWYSVYNPSQVGMVQRSIREMWHFRNKPILVVLDPQGKELNLNAFHMMWIWGSNAFPFSIAREEALWREETWRLELLTSGMDPTILDWVRESRYIFLYGGDDIEWIRKFTSNARAIARAAGIPLEMCYVGKSKQRENVRRAIATINVEKLSYFWEDLTLVWFFWTRIESMLFSKIQLKHADDQDLVMLQIKKLLSYDKDGSWGLLCRGSHILTIGHGSTMLQTCVDFDLWKQHIPSRGFDLSFKNYHDKLHGATNNCSRFEFPIVEGSIPEGMRCPECHRSMEKHIAFICCHDQTGLLEPY
ncbi:hypothetical protein QVD17_06730 [Tagetes erecta]|uniref:Sieve element occlusion n=1 Tax=Tagetes erecta TaxID=13708 RepID=A0AAD8PCE0_TARER|nr:hypothetical protein QVD17_06730 [Tagetes erecta]